MKKKSTSRRVPLESDKSHKKNDTKNIDSTILSLLLFVQIVLESLRNRPTNALGSTL